MQWATNKKIKSNRLIERSWKKNSDSKFRDANHILIFNGEASSGDVGAKIDWRFDRRHVTCIATAAHVLGRKRRTTWQDEMVATMTLKSHVNDSRKVPILSRVSVLFTWQFQRRDMKVHFCLCGWYINVAQAGSSKSFNYSCTLIHRLMLEFL